MAAVYLTIDYGRPPWISLAVAFTFAFYGLSKKLVGASLTALHSLTAETAVLLPVALVIVVVLGARDATTFLGHGPAHTVLLLAAGVFTAIPMLFFGAAARRIPLSHVGLLQFVTPALQLLCGVLLLGENMPLSRWVGFGIVWIALTVLSVDMARLGLARRADVRSRGRQDPADRQEPAETLPGTTHHGRSALDERGQVKHADARDKEV